MSQHHSEKKWDDTLPTAVTKKKKKREAHYA
jgi:hypothetical protein